MRNKIKEKLLEVQKDGRVFYGLVPETMFKEDWNYIVFNQSHFEKTGTSSNDLSITWNVVLIREDFISNELVAQVITKMLEIPGLRLSNEQFSIEYTQKGSTTTVVELLNLRFTKMWKGVC